MATVKVFIPTYRRHALLKRSIRSLQAQIFKDWVAEIHNDDPEDEFPSAFINSIGDSRFTVNNHRYNLGAVASFNLMYKPTDATYVCLLEDDNWWEESW
ncbi:MAG: glycosyltransferase [Bacteroidota bacterium]